MGVKRITQALSESLVRSLRASLRFSAELKDKAVYCALLLKVRLLCAQEHAWQGSQLKSVLSTCSLLEPRICCPVWRFPMPSLRCTTS